MPLLFYSFIPTDVDILILSMLMIVLLLWLKFSFTDLMAKEGKLIVGTYSLVWPNNTVCCIIMIKNKCAVL